MNNSIILEKSYKYDKEIIWKALTDKKYIAKWLMDTDFKLEKDLDFKLIDKNAKGWDGVVHCKLIDFEENKKLVYRWNNDKSETATIVEFTIEQNGEETSLKINHTGFKGIKGQFTKIVLASGWNRMMKNKIELVLEEILKNQK